MNSKISTISVSGSLSVSFFVFFFIILAFLPVTGANYLDYRSDKSESSSDFVIDGNKSIRITPDFEIDLQNNQHCNDDANGNAHNVFINDDDVYIYALPYIGEPTLRKYDTEKRDFDDLNIFTASWAEDIFNNTNNWLRTVVTDDNGHLCYIQTTSNPHFSINGIALAISVRAFEGDTKDGEPYHDSTFFEKDLNDNCYRDHFMPMYEVSISGDAFEGNFVFTINGLHSYESSIDNPDNLHAASVKYKFKNFSLSSKEYIYYDSQNYNDYKKENGFICVNEAETGLHIVQSNNLTSPLLFKETQETINNLPSSYISHVYSQLDAWEDYKPMVDEPHYGVHVVKVGDETLLLTNERLWGEGGPQFKLSRWTGDHQSFDGLEDMWKFPVDNTYGVPASNNRYFYARPLVAIQASSSQSSASAPSQRAGQSEGETRIVTYVPGSGLASYRLSLVDNNETVTGIEEVLANDVDQTPAEVHIDGRRVTVSRKTKVAGDATCDVCSYDGRLLSSYPLRKTSTEIDFTECLPGVYILRLENCAWKLLIK